MVKIATFAKRKTPLKALKKAQKKEVEIELEDFECLGLGKKLDTTAYLTNPDNIGKAIMECLENNDPEGVMEVISIYLEALNKSKISKDNALHRQTMYSALKHKNPTIKTLAKLMSSYVH